MNVGMILDGRFPPDPRVENEAVTLINSGVEVSLFCLDYQNKKDSREEINGIRVYRKACPHWVYKLSALAYTIPVYHWVMQRWIRAFIDDSGVDAVHIHDLQVARAVFKLRVSQDMSVVLDLHENRPEIMKFYNHLTRFPGKYLISPKRWAKFERKYISQASRTVVVTEEARDHYVDLWGSDASKFIVLPNTVRDSFSQEARIEPEILDRYQDNFVILYVGDTGLRRGLLTAIEAMSSLKKEMPDVKLVIVGSNKSDDVLKQKVSELDLNEYVHFEGWQDFKRFQSYISASEVCISPLHRNIHHDTTFANKIFQYMALGKPLVVSDCPAQENIVRRAGGGLIHKAEDVEDYIAQILKIFQDEKLRKKLGESGASFVRDKYGWEKTSESFVSYYQNI